MIDAKMALIFLAVVIVIATIYGVSTKEEFESERYLVIKTISSEEGVYHVVQGLESGDRKRLWDGYMIEGDTLISYRQEVFGGLISGIRYEVSK